jgi:hypothetical protein
MDAAWERAIRGGDVEAARRLLRAAIVAGHVAVAGALIRAGADLTVRGAGAPGFAGKTAYDLAAAREMRELYPQFEARNA